MHIAALSNLHNYFLILTAALHSLRNFNRVVQPHETNVLRRDDRLPENNLLLGVPHHFEVGVTDALLLAPHLPPLRQERLARKRLVEILLNGGDLRLLGRRALLVGFLALFHHLLIDDDLRPGAVDVHDHGVNQRWENRVLAHEVRDDIEVKRRSEQLIAAPGYGLKIDKGVVDVGDGRVHVRLVL